MADNAWTNSEQSDGEELALKGTLTAAVQAKIAAWEDAIAKRQAEMDKEFEESIKNLKLLPLQPSMVIEPPAFGQGKNQNPNDETNTTDATENSALNQSLSTETEEKTNEPSTMTLGQAVSLGFRVGTETLNMDVSKFITDAINELVDYSFDAIQKAIADIVSFPSPGDLAGDAAKKMKEHLISPGDLLKTLTLGMEAVNAIQDTLQDAQKLQSVTDELMGGAVAKLNDLVGKKISTLKVELGELNPDSYIVKGPQWFEDKKKNILKKYKDLVDAQVLAITKPIKDKKEKWIEQYVDNQAKAIATAANGKAKKTAKQTLDKVNVNLQKVTVLAKDAIQQAKIAILKLIGG